MCPDKDRMIEKNVQNEDKFVSCIYSYSSGLRLRFRFRLNIRTRIRFTFRARK